MVSLLQDQPPQHDHASLHILHAAQVQKHRAPLPHARIAIAPAKNTQAMIDSGVVHPRRFNAKIIITIVNHAPIGVNLQHPEIKKRPAKISPTTAIQNRVDTDKKVRPSAGPAPPTIWIIWASAHSFINPIYNIQRPITIRITHITLLHSGEHCFMWKIRKYKKHTSCIRIFSISTSLSVLTFMFFMMHIYKISWKLFFLE